jgi:hypothetical protein
MCGVEIVATNVGGRPGAGDSEVTTAVGASPVAVTRVKVDAMVGASGGKSAEEGALGAQAQRIKIQKRAARSILIILD